MYKPANIREFVTPAIHKKPTTTMVNGRSTKTFAAVGNVRGKFKQKGTTETTANGLSVVTTNTTFTTWYKKNYAAADRLEIGGADYEVKGNPENVEGRSRYSVLILERVGGGA
jgi:SPP1 family predicted phage head-tail adaptor